ncbi:hypothetical protein ABBQ38_011045 [Trebouxia sp. C0009 RCD-2024]
MRHFPHLQAIVALLHFFYDVDKAVLGVICIVVCRGLLLSSWPSCVLDAALKSCQPELKQQRLAACLAAVEVRQCYTSHTRYVVNKGMPESPLIAVAACDAIFCTDLLHSFCLCSAFQGIGKAEASTLVSALNKVTYRACGWHDICQLGCI